MRAKWKDWIQFIIDRTPPGTTKWDQLMHVVDKVESQRDVKFVLMTVFYMSEEQFNREMTHWFWHLQDRKIEQPQIVLELKEKPDSVEENQHWGMIDSTIIEDIYTTPGGVKMAKVDLYEGSVVVEDLLTQEEYVYFGSAYPNHGSKSGV